MKKLVILLVILLSTAACSNASQEDSTQVKTFTLAEVATHSNASDCWVIIDNAVYDLTSYLPSHPGGERSITNLCGQDASVAFEGIKNGAGHSSTAERLVDTYYKGDLKN